MKEKIKYILIGVVFLILAFVAPVLFADLTFYISFIPVNATVIAWVFGIIGVLAIVVGILDKKKN